MRNLIFRKKNRLFRKVVQVLVAGLFFISTTLSLMAEIVTMETRYPDLAHGFLKSATLETMDDDILLKADEFTIRKSEILSAIENHDPKLRPQLEKNLIFILEQETIHRVLLNEAQKAGIARVEKDDNQTIRALFEHKTKGISVSEKEVESFYQANKDLVGDVPFDQVAEGIKHYILQDKKQQAIKDYLDTLRDTVHLRVNETWIKDQSVIAGDNPVDKARRSDKPTLVEFGATGCVPCDMMQPILEKLRKDYSEKLNVVFIHVGEEPILASRFGIRAIPVQVFFDARGQEVFRHTGFLAENEVTGQLAKMGVTK